MSFSMTDPSGSALMLLTYVRANATPGDPESVLATIDKFCMEKQWMMHVGDKKGHYIREAINELTPMTCLEMGTYCGYSSILIANLLPTGARLITVEASERHAEIAKEIMTIAGVDHKITIINKTMKDAISTMDKDYSVAAETVDFVFIDHDKTMYKQDLQLMEAFGLLRKGAVILADNMVHPGAPDYLTYVESSPKYQTEVFHTTLQYTNAVPDAVAKSVYIG